MNNETITTAVPESPEDHQLLSAITMENDAIARVDEAPGLENPPELSEIPVDRVSGELSGTTDNITAVIEAQEDHEALKATTMGNEAIANVDEAPGHGSFTELSETPANSDSCELCGTKDSITADLKVQENGEALEAPKCQPSALSDSGDNESFPEDEPCILNGTKASQVHPYNNGLDSWDESQIIPEEFEALAVFTYNDKLDSDLFERHNNLLGDNPDEETVNGDSVSAFHGVDPDTEILDTPVPANLGEEDLNHSSSNEPPER